MTDMRASPPLPMTASTAGQSPFPPMSAHGQGMMPPGLPQQMPPPHPATSMHMGQLLPQSTLPSRLPGHYGMNLGSQALHNHAHMTDITQPPPSMSEGGSLQNQGGGGAGSDGGGGGGGGRENMTSQSHSVTSTSQENAQHPQMKPPINGLQSPTQNHPESTTVVHNDRTHICPSCSKGFKSKQQLAQHDLVHSGIRKYICSYCEKAFKQLCHLQQHTRIHTGEKPYKCTFDNCDRAFAQMANLHHHMRNHDDHLKKAASKQYHCMICHRAYTNESSLKSHTLKMHVHIKPLEQRLISGLPMKPRKPRQLTIKDDGDSVVAIDLTGDDEGGGGDSFNDLSGSDAINKEIMQRAELLLRSENLARVDALARVANFRFDNMRQRSDNIQRYSQSDGLSSKDAMRSDGILSPESLLRSDNISRMIDMATGNLQRGDNSQQRADNLQRHLENSQNVHSSSLQRLAEEQASRNNNLHRMLEEQNSRTLDRLAEEQLHRADPIQRLIDQSVHHSSLMGNRSDGMSQCNNLQDTLDASARGKNLSSDVLTQDSRASNLTPNPSNLEPSYYRSSSYDLSSRLSAGLHLPMRLPTTMSGFAPMGSPNNASALAFSSSTPSHMGNGHSRPSSSHMPVTPASAASP